MKSTWMVFILAFVLCGAAAAQSTFDPSRHIPGAGAMTWTGALQNFDADTHTITLVRDKKGKPETFTGLISSDVKFLDAKGNQQPDKKLKVGENMKVYFHKMRGEKDVRHNVVVRIDLLDRKPDTAQ